jgi:protein subunit release factor A
MKLKDIGRISSDSIKLLTEFGSPGMTESLERIKEIASTVQEITASLEDPEMVKNIENVRSANKAIQDTGDRTKGILTQLNESGIIDETKKMASSLKSKRDSIQSNQDLKEMISSLRNTFRSVRSLVVELRTSQIAMTH